MHYSSQHCWVEKIQLAFVQYPTFKERHLTLEFIKKKKKEKPKPMVF